jgi:hypothetical protein
MKKTILAVGVLAGAVGANAQGTIDWRDFQNGFSVSILSPNIDNPFIEETGNTQYDIPAGNATYTGGWIGNTDGSPGPGVGATPASGDLGINYQNATGFTMGLYLDTSLPALTADIRTGSPLATATFLSGGNAGLYNVAAPMYVSGFPAGTPVWVGLSAWYSAGGATSYAGAVADGTVEGYVESTTTVALSGLQSGPPTLATLAGLPGLTSFSLGGAPEPGTLALVVIGTSAVLLRLRHK